MALSGTIRKSVVDDYFTPSIKAEVILDTLLTPVIHALVPGTELVAKEMSIPEWAGSETDTQYGVHGPKIDYVLAGPAREKVYLVELKTTLSSLNDQQADSYLRNCGQKSATFGGVLGRQLLALLQKRSPDGFGVTQRFKDPEAMNGGKWNDQSLAAAFNIILEKVDPDKCLRGVGPRPEQAKRIILARGWAQSMDLRENGEEDRKKQYRSRKYLYTLGRVAEYIERTGDALWKKHLEIIYLSPGGACPESSFRGVDLDTFVSSLPDTPYTQMLRGIMRGIFGEIKHG